jgi:hypothetical protein
MNLNIKQILDERPHLALRIEENYGTNTDGDHARAKDQRHAVHFEQKAQVLSQL